VKPVGVSFVYRKLIYQESLAKDERLRIGIRIYSSLQIMTTLFNRVFGNTLWLPSFLLVITSVLPMAVYGVLKLGDRLDIVSYAYLCIAVPCIMCINLGLFYPMAAVEEKSSKVLTRTRVNHLLSRYESLHRTKSANCLSDTGDRSGDNAILMAEQKEILKRKLKFIKSSLAGCQPLHCSLLTFGVVKKKTKQNLITVLVDLTIYLLLTF